MLKPRLLLSLVLLLAVPSFSEGQLFRTRIGPVRSAAGWKCGNPNCPMCYPENFQRQASRVTATYTPSGASRPTTRLASVHSRVDRVASPSGAVDAFLDMFPLRPVDVLYDVGCGDGRVLIAAAKRYGCRCVGIEIDEEVADLARVRCYRAGFGPDRIRIITGDAADYELTGATYVYLFQTTEVLARVVPRIAPNAIVVSCMHRLPVRRQLRIEERGVTFYVRQP